MILAFSYSLIQVRAETLLHFLEEFLMVFFIITHVVWVVFRLVIVERAYYIIKFLRKLIQRIILAVELVIIIVIILKITPDEIIIKDLVVWIETRSLIILTKLSFLQFIDWINLMMDKR